MAPDEWFWTRLACPVTGRALVREGNVLRSPEGRTYPIVEGIPVLLPDDVAPTQPAIVARTRVIAENGPEADSGSPTDGVHPHVQRAIGATGGYFYERLIGQLGCYPIPRLRLPLGRGRILLDIGCNWGRWSIAASQLGYRTIGVDPNVEALLAARQVARDLGAAPLFVAGDARTLPFVDGAFDVAFSYSVLQHFPKESVRRTIAEIGRVLQPGGRSVIQMLNARGLRSVQHQARRGFRDARDFEVRYWTIDELRAAFEAIGATEVRVDGFFSANAQVADLDLLPTAEAVALTVSHYVGRFAARVPALAEIADSVYVESRRAPATWPSGHVESRIE